MDHQSSSLDRWSHHQSPVLSCAVLSCHAMCKAFFKSHATVTSRDVKLTKEATSQRITTSSRRPYSDKHRTGKNCNVQMTRDQCHVHGILQIPCDSYVSRRETNQGNNESTHYNEFATTFFLPLLYLPFFLRSFLRDKP